MSDPNPDLELLYEYEQLRRAGFTTMSDYQRTQIIAAQMGYNEVANATRDEYLEILDYYRKYSRPIDSI